MTFHNPAGIGHNSDRVQLQFSDPQYDLLTTTARFPAFVGGFGSGKTAALIQKALMLKSKYTTGNIAYYMPTFDLISMVAIPRFEEELDKIGAVYKTVKTPRPHIDIEDGGSIIFRTMDNPNRIVGYEVMDSFVDELDILKIDVAANAWRKILARNRQKKPDGAGNSISVGCTPEGFKFVYETWAKDPNAKAKGYELIKASTYSNACNLPDDYIDDLLAAYPTQLIQAYINGEFVNLTSGAVYPEFDRIFNGSAETIGTYKDKATGAITGEDLHIGMDFNVMKMAAAVFVRRAGFPHAVEEITGVFDTPAMIAVIKRRYPNHRIFIYPDASGGSRKSNDASVSDLSLLHQAGFHIYAKAVNPAVKDRVLSINGLILNAKQQRRLFVNADACPNLVESLEKQVYNDLGEPDKTTGLDHIIDAAGYFIAFTFPVLGKPMNKMKMVGH